MPWVYVQMVKCGVEGLQAANRAVINAGAGPNPNALPYDRPTTDGIEQGNN